MQTIILDQPGHFTLTDMPEPGAPGPGEALVRVRRIGICGTDMHAYHGTMPFIVYPRILGHELGVEVVAVGPDVDMLRPDDLCSVEPYLNCGTCIACRRGRTNCCTALKVLGVHTDGGMREYITLPAHKLHRSERLTVDQLALVETLVIGAHAVRRAAPMAGEFALVIGAGPIGLTVIEAARQTGAEIIVSEINPNRLAFAQHQLGVEHAIDARSTDVTTALREITGGDLPTLVFDATGSIESMDASFGYLANGGQLVFVGVVKGDVTFTDSEFHRRETTLMSSRNGTAADFAWVIDQIERGYIDTTPWITHRAPFPDLIDAFPTWTDLSNGVIKAVVELG